MSFSPGGAPSSITASRAQPALYTGITRRSGVIGGRLLDGLQKIILNNQSDLGCRDCGNNFRRVRSCGTHGRLFLHSGASQNVGTARTAWTWRLVGQIDGAVGGLHVSSSSSVDGRTVEGRRSRKGQQASQRLGPPGQWT